jgi:hypothetical protein
MKSFLKKGEYTIKKSTIENAGKGAFTNIYLRKGTILGNYKGQKLSKKQYDKLSNDNYVWELSSKNGPFYIDARKKGNWLRYLNDSRDKRINVEPYQYKQKIFYRTNKDIKEGSELFVSYGDEYWN